jgi:hypothetical protein
MIRNCLIPLFLLFCAALRAQNPVPSLQGRWEVVRYSEQGVSVDKKQDALRQAVTVYRHVQEERALRWYGYDYESANEYSKRRAREFERWEERDSTKEVQRIAEAIATPYFAVFFPDSTLALYNKSNDGFVSFQEARQYAFQPGTMSLKVYSPGFLPPPTRGGWVDRLNIQVISLTADRMTLFLPEEAEIVELVRTAFSLP